MAKEQLSLANLHKLDFGKAAHAFQSELQHVVKDCLDRPLDNRARSVTMKFILKPRVDSQSEADCDKVLVGCEIQSSVPKRQTRVYEMSPTNDGRLGFHPELPDDAEGHTLYDEVDTEDGEGGKRQ